MDVVETPKASALEAKDFKASAIEAVEAALKEIKDCDARTRDGDREKRLKETKALSPAIKAAIDAIDAYHKTLNDAEADAKALLAQEMQTIKDIQIKLEETTSVRGGLLTFIIKGALGRIKKTLKPPRSAIEAVEAALKEIKDFKTAQAGGDGEKTFKEFTDLSSAIKSAVDAIDAYHKTLNDAEFDAIALAQELKTIKDKQTKLENITSFEDIALLQKDLTTIESDLRDIKERLKPEVSGLLQSSHIAQNTAVVNTLLLSHSDHAKTAQQLRKEEHQLQPTHQ